MSVTNSISEAILKVALHPIETVNCAGDQVSMYRLEVARIGSSGLCLALLCDAQNRLTGPSLLASDDHRCDHTGQEPMFSTLFFFK